MKITVLKYGYIFKYSYFLCTRNYESHLIKRADYSNHGQALFEAAVFIFNFLLNVEKIFFTLKDFMCKKFQIL